MHSLTGQHTHVMEEHSKCGGDIYHTGYQPGPGLDLVYFLAPCATHLHLK